MVEATCAGWLSAFRCDGLRFDSANDLPREVMQVCCVGANVLAAPGEKGGWPHGSHAAAAVCRGRP
jgi:hypothetical protein